MKGEFGGAQHWISKHSLEFKQSNPSWGITLEHSLSNSYSTHKNVKTLRLSGSDNFFLLTEGVMLQKEAVGLPQGQDQQW